MELDDCFEIGYILKPHGLKGAVSIHLDADDPSKYHQMESVIVKIGDNLIPFFISDIHINGSKGVLHFEDVRTVEDAEGLRSCPLLLPLELLPKLAENQFYYHEVIGYTVVDRERGPLGLIDTIFSSGRQDLISMNYSGKEVLIPIVPEVVIRANHPKREVEVILPEGLLEIYF